MVPEDSKLPWDSFAFFLNVTTSVLIVFINKVLMDSTVGYGFTFATTLCALHFLASAAYVLTMECLEFSTPARMPWRGAGSPQLSSASFGHEPNPHPRLTPHPLPREFTPCRHDLLRERRVRVNKQHEHLAAVQLRWFLPGAAGGAVAVAVVYGKRWHGSVDRPEGAVMAG